MARELAILFWHPAAQTTGSGFITRFMMSLRCWQQTICWKFSWRMAGTAALSVLSA